MTVISFSYIRTMVLLDVLSRFIGGALAVGDSVIVIATKAHQDGLAQRLKARDWKQQRQSAKGVTSYWNENETLPKIMANGSVDETRFINTISDVLSRVCNAADDKDSRVAVFGELVALLWADGKPWRLCESRTCGTTQLKNIRSGFFVPTRSPASRMRDTSSHF